MGFWHAGLHQSVLNVKVMLHLYKMLSYSAAHVSELIIHQIGHAVELKKMNQLFSQKLIVSGN